MLTASEADYTRTAVLKGLKRRNVVLHHILRNALVPTVAVLATQTGYLLGGLVVIETLFSVQGLGSLILGAAKSRDFPLLEGGVLVMAAAYVVTSAFGDIMQAVWILANDGVVHYDDIGVIRANDEETVASDHRTEIRSRHRAGDPFFLGYLRCIRSGSCPVRPDGG